MNDNSFFDVCMSAKIRSANRLVIYFKRTRFYVFFLKIYNVNFFRKFENDYNFKIKKNYKFIL